MHSDPTGEANWDICRSIAILPAFVGSAGTDVRLVIASLLAKDVFHGEHPDGGVETFATVVGVLGAGALLLFVVLLLRPYELGFTVNAPATYRALWEQGILDQPMVDLALADALRSSARPTRGPSGVCLGSWPWRLAHSFWRPLVLPPPLR